VLVTKAMPKGFTGPFDLIDGVWVCQQSCAMPVAVALREALIALTAARSNREGSETKAELVFITDNNQGAVNLVTLAIKHDDVCCSEPPG